MVASLILADILDGRAALFHTNLNSQYRDVT